MFDRFKERQDENGISYWSQHRLAFLIGCAILISIGLVTFSMSLYNSSGAAQLDLSRPGYKSVSNKVDHEKTDVDEYGATGPIDEASISQFKKLYRAQADKVKAVDAFSGDVLNDQSLGLDAPSSNE